MGKKMYTDRSRYIPIPIVGTNEELLVPIKLGNCFSPRYAMNIDKLINYKDHRRLTVFFNKGLYCAVPGCSRVGKWLIAALDAGGGMHIDVYTDTFALMTVDHILPRSKGGGEELSNKQPMCRYHNSKKSDHILTLEELSKNVSGNVLITKDQLSLIEGDRKA